jgi:hypothetical protein
MFTGAVYNVVDDDPASRAEVIAYAEQLITGRPAAETPEPSSTDAAMPRCAAAFNFCISLPCSLKVSCMFSIHRVELCRK